MANNNALKFISDSLIGVEEPWAITGGCSTYLQNCQHKPNDIDIITTLKGVEILKEHLSRNNRQIKESENQNIRSHYFSINRHGVTIEVMGNPYNYIRGKWVKNDFWEESIKSITYQGIPLKVTTLEYEIKINEMLGNVKRVKQIRNA